MDWNLYKVLLPVMLTVIWIAYKKQWGIDASEDIHVYMVRSKNDDIYDAFKISRFMFWFSWFVQIMTCSVMSVYRLKVRSHDAIFHPIFLSDLLLTKFIPCNHWSRKQSLKVDWISNSIWFSIDFLVRIVTGNTIIPLNWLHILRTDCVTTSTIDLPEEVWKSDEKSHLLTAPI